MEKNIYLHIGYFKTGTTWFQNEFFPNLENVSFHNHANSVLDDMLVLKRPFDFSSNAIKSHIDGYFKDQTKKSIVLSRERLSGHPFTGGFDAKQIADRLYATFPNATVIIFIREQKNAIVSTYKEYVKRGGTAPLKKWLLNESKTIPSFDLDYFNYHKQITYYQKLFGKPQVKVYLYEEFADNKNEFLEQFCEDLDFKNPITVTQQLKKVNKGYSTFAIELIRMGNKFSLSKNLNPYPSIKIPFLRFLLEKVSKIMDAYFFKTLNKNALDQDITQYLNNYFSDGNRVLSTLLNKNLDKLGYACKIRVS